jgi:hypothetical protein
MSKFVAESDPIPEELSEALEEAVIAYLNWEGDNLEPLISFKYELWAITSVCRLLTSFRDPMPHDVFSYLSLESSRCLPDALIENTYGNGALVLVRLIEVKGERFRAKKWK